MWRLVAPRAGRRPVSDLRCRTEMTMMVATPNAPTSRATAPRPRYRPLSADAASARAVRAADGWLTAAWLGSSGSAVAASSDWTLSTWLTWLVLVRTEIVEGCPSKPRERPAAG